MSRADVFAMRRWPLLRPPQPIRPIEMRSLAPITREAEAALRAPAVAVPRKPRLVRCDDMVASWSRFDCSTWGKQSCLRAGFRHQGPRHVAQAKSLVGRPPRAAPGPLARPEDSPERPKAGRQAFHAPVVRVAQVFASPSGSCPAQVPPTGPAFARMAEVPNGLEKQHEKLAEMDMSAGRSDAAFAGTAGRRQNCKTRSRI